LQRKLQRGAIFYAGRLVVRHPPVAARGCRAAIPALSVGLRRLRGLRARGPPAIYLAFWPALPKILLTPPFGCAYTAPRSSEIIQ
jgi:hypothetical protein